VITYSPADKAGVKVDDIIVSFNRVRLEEEVSLFGMMMACSSDNRIVLEVLREKGASIIELVYMEP
jgi:S1-C subfamily serine protease